MVKKRELKNLTGRIKALPAGRNTGRKENEMKEYRIVCTIERTDEKGHTARFENVSPWISCSSLPHERRFDERKKAEEYLAFCKKCSKEFCERSKKEFEKNPKNRYLYKQTYFKIQSRTVSEWK